MKKITKRLLAGIVVCTMIFSSINLQTMASAKKSKAKLSGLSGVKFQKYSAEKPGQIDLLKTRFKKTDIPQELVEDVGIDLGAIKDIDETDSLDLYSFTTVKKDNSKTLYIFDSPVKYYDKKENKVRFIDNSLKKSNRQVHKSVTYELENSSNNVKIYVPKKNDESILVEDKDKLSLKFKPIGKNVSNVTVEEVEFLGEAEECAEYKDVFGKGYHLQYVPQNTGVKENIIIEKNLQKYSFDFMVETNGLVPKTLEGKTIDFVKKGTTEVVFNLGELFVKDSYVGGSNRNDHISFDNSYKIRRISEGKYQLTYVLDKKFLDSKSTKYPVLVDPSISPISSIKDAPVYSSKSTSNFASNAWIQLGNVGGSYGTGYGFFQTTAIKNYTYINPKKITSATLRVYEGSGTTYTSEIKAYDTDDIWSSTSITWKNRPGKDGSALDTKKISSSGFYEFKITSPVKEWLADQIGEGGYEAAYGVMLVPKNSSQKRKDFCSANYGTASKRPTIKIEYTEDTTITEDIYFLQNYNSGLYLDVNTSNDNVRQLLIDYSDRQQWQVVKKKNGYYTIANKNYGAKGYLDVEDIESNNADIWQDGSDDWIKFKIVKNNDGSGTYRIMSKVLDDIKALYTVSGSIKSGANVKFASYTGNAKSQWKFIKVADRYKKPDLAVSRIITSKANTTMANNTYAAQITNNYTKAATTTTTFEFINSSNMVVNKISVNTPAIQAGKSATVSTAWKPSAVGTYKVRVTANATNNVSENNKSNNVFTKSFTAIVGFTAIVNNYYDMAFDLRYSSCGNRVTQLQKLNNEVKKVFKDTFGLIITNNTPQRITSLSDNCKYKRGVPINSTTINSKCPGGTNHNPSCTDPMATYSDFIAKYPGNNTKVSVLWTGNALFDSEGIQSNRSFFCSNNGICLSEIYSPEDEFVEMQSCLTHELSHFLGAPDHYHEIREDGSCTGGSLCKKCNPSSNRSTTCIMCNGWQNIASKEDKSQLYCTGCYNDINKHLKDHH